MTAGADRPSNDRLTVSQFVADLRAERSTFLVLTLAAVSLAVVHYGVTPGWLFPLLPASLHPLIPSVWWTGTVVIMWIALPWALARWLGFAPRDLGLGISGLRGREGIFALLYLAVVPLILWAATTTSFVDTYPLLRIDNDVDWTWRLLVGYWLLYCLQFVGVEFFFRGFLLFTLRPRFGYAAIAIMVVPYCMIHFPKPFPEAIGAIIGGTVLGWLALRLETIWGGVMVHVAVALTMDVLALVQGTTGWPRTW